MNHNDVQLILIDQENLDIFISLARAYEAEFSNLTRKMPCKSGNFKVDTLPFAPYVGYLLYYQDIPIGFCVANVMDTIHDIAEFYIVPAVRKQNFGYKLASMIFDKYPGHWQVRQIQGAEAATQFWRSTIKKYTQNNYQESTAHDPQWGEITLQQFRA